MAQVVTTKYLGPTNSRGSRVKVNSWQGSKSYNWHCELSTEENHSLAVANFLCELNKKRQGDMKWHIVAGGGMPDGVGYGFVIDLK